MNESAPLDQSASELFASQQSASQAAAPEPATSGPADSGPAASTAGESDPPRQRIREEPEPDTRQIVREALMFLLMVVLFGAAFVAARVAWRGPGVLDRIPSQSGSR